MEGQMMNVTRDTTYMTPPEVLQSRCQRDGAWPGRIRARTITGAARGSLPASEVRYTNL
jgi:hypothetical protein